MSPVEILNLFRNSTSAYDVCKKLNYRSSNKFVWDKIENIAKQYGFDKSQYKSKRKYCLVCGKELHGYQKKFCSHSCSATYNNSNRMIYKKKGTNKNVIKVEHRNYGKKYNSVKHKEDIDIKYCLNCGNILSTNNRIFCSQKCSNEYKYKERIIEWLNGHNPIIKGGQLPPYIKKYLMDKFNNKCELCGWGEINPTTGKIPLEVHHIDGNCYNNNIDNLQLLCPNCHSITPNYKALNKNCKREYTIVHK